ncbi:MAG: acetylxylan esterase [Candidatus Solibacter usitatus]|nr:acetylxylan esterase [Candidatus Solibacter usitatus]
MKTLLPLFLAAAALAQTTVSQVRRLLEPPLLSSDVVHFELRRYLMRKAPHLPKPSTAEAWTRETQRLRQHLLDDVVFHGWPKEWVAAPPRFETVGAPIEGPGYRIRRLRYEIVPGIQGAALLYEPAQMNGRMPAIVNVNGHVGPPGKAVEYKQKRCIQDARMGILSLNLEWFSFGELGHKENSHWYAAHLDLAGASGVGLFYLAMRKGVDYFWEHPNVDRARIGVTGLSGGGWQTIFLGALDERVAAAVPVAGYSAAAARIERPQDTGDIEQNPTDFLAGQDYSHLTAMLASRAALLVYNAEDDCCFRAPLVKSQIFDDVRPFFRLYGREDRFAWHENTDPGDHNYQLDNRLASYRFFAREFGLPAIERESAVDDQVRTPEELAVGLPPDNLTILGLARKLAARIERAPADRDRLRRALRYRETAVEHAWALANSKNKGLESRSYRFDFSNGLSATGVWLKAVTTPEGAPVTILLDDRGKKAMAAEVSDRLNRGEQVLAADLLFTGDAAPANPGASSYAQMLSAMGDRPLGLQAAQLIALARWTQGASVRLETTGMRAQVVGRSAAAIEPALLSLAAARDGMASLTRLLETPIEYQAAPELFCLDLLKELDVAGPRGGPTP